MMTIDALKLRRRELQMQKETELQLKEEGKGDNFALFMINEELIEINAQLRSLTNGRRIGHRMVSTDQFSGHGGQVDQKLYKEWEESQGADPSVCSKGEKLLQLLNGMDDILTEKQMAYLRLWSTGVSMESVALHFGVSKSTVSRTITRAKNRMQTAAQAQEMEHKAGTRELDLSDPGTAKLVLQALTDKQAVYLYLYYAQWLSLREIAELLGIKSHQSVMISIHTGLRNIGRVFGYDALTIKNVDAIDDLAYGIYQQIDPAQLLQEQEKAKIDKILKPERKQNRNYRYIRSKDLPQVKISKTLMSSVTVDTVWLPGRKNRPCGKWRAGKLLTALLDRKRACNANPKAMMAWMATVFRQLTNNIGGKIRWKYNKKGTCL